MSAEIMSFDTLQFVKKLTFVGVPQQQAEIQAEALKEIIDDKFATKHDLKESELALRRDLKEFEVALRHDMKQMEVALRNDMKEMELSLRRDVEKLDYDLQAFKIENQRDHEGIELRMTIKLGSIVIAGMSILIILLKLFHL